MKNIPNLGTALTILARAEAYEADLHIDVSAWGAPSECHGAVSRGEEVRQRRARKHAEAITRRPYRIIRRQAAERGCPIGSPRYQGLVGRLISHPAAFA